MQFTMGTQFIQSENTAPYHQQSKQVSHISYVFLKAVNEAE